MWEVWKKIVGSQKHRHSLRCGGVFHISSEYHCLTIYITRSSLIFQIVSCFSMIKLSFTFFRKAPILILEPIVGTGHGGVTSRERESVEVLPAIGFSYIPSYKQPFKSGISFYVIKLYRLCSRNYILQLQFIADSLIIVFCFLTTGINGISQPS